jgi:hypothetical protein
MAGGVFLVVGGLSGYTFARQYSDRPPPVMWREAVEWPPVALGAVLFTLGLYTLTSLRKPTE